MTLPTYAGIGARTTPKTVLDNMTTISAWLARTGWRRSSGGAQGADAAFANAAPAGTRTLYLPWPGYNGHRGADCRFPSPSELAAWIAAAEPLHPAWRRCSPAVRKLHARNAAVILGPGLDCPVDAVVAWTPEGAVTGGTGMALRIAADRGIPVFNLAVLSPRAACEPLQAIRRAARV